MKKIMMWGKRNHVLVMLMAILLFAGIVGESRIVTATTVDTTTEMTGNDIPDTEETKEESIKLNKTAVTMSPATTVKLKLNGANGKVKWNSEDKKIATVTTAGKVTAKAKGKVHINAECNGKTYTCAVTVKYQTYSSKDGMEYKDAKGTFGYSGRWFKKSISGGKYYFTNTEGSAIYFKVTGSKYVNVNFVSKIAVATPYFAYSVDGKSMKRQPITEKKISVGNTKTHYVRLVIDSMSESENRWAGEAGVGIKSIKPVTKTGVVTAVKPQNKTIVFYGDSITQGVRALGMALAPTDTSATHSYAWYCADRLNMVPYYVGYGGSGIVESGSFTKCGNAISNYSASRKVSKISPDVIVIEHGTNDVKTDAAAFTSEYKKILQQLHKKYPKAKIMAMIPFTGLHTVEIRMAASGYKWCTVVETASWKISYTDGLHPNAKGAKVVGKNLAKKIASKLK
ncbi:MAG: Ig-like domain-containing protein [Lachnospiraceae bacterium]|nr:Ig-like domain-containing protein [Lachnospiraceae bacterium]